MKARDIIVTCAAVVMSACAGVAYCADASTVGLEVNHLVSPANVGSSPKFAWRMDSARRGAAQTAYRIEVFEGCAKKGKKVWDSGEVADGRSVAVSYAGAALIPLTRYTWRVSVTDETGARLKPVSACFTTGLFGDGAWAGSKWISAVDSNVSAYPGGHDSRTVKQEAEDGTSCFVKTVANGKDVKEAWLVVAGLGVFEAYVNGQPVSRRLADGTLRRDFLKPGFTHYEKTKHSFAYDVTHLVRKGAADANVFAAQVSAGWWRDKIVNFHGKKSAFRAVLVLRHKDGSETRVGTDETWLSSIAGPVLRAAIFDGEDYDARVSQSWMAGDDLAGFKPSEANDEFKGGLFPMEGPGISLRRDLAIAPVEMYVWKGVEGATDKEFGRIVKLRSFKGDEEVSLSGGETLIVDFGQNAAAVPEFEFSAAAGTTLSMRPAEMLNDGNGAKSRGCDGPEGSIYTTNYRKARTTLNYTFAGSGVEKYHPEFTFFGYRYVSITVTGDVRISKIRSLPVTSIGCDMETGRLVTGVADVNRLIKNVLWGQYSNYLSVPTDCPQRNERLGWTADTQVFAHAGSFNADTYGFFIKWMRDMRDTQHDDGSYTGVAPLAQYGGNGHQLGWADAGVIVPYVMWKQFGDTAIIDQNWESMKKYVALVDSMRYTSKEATEHQWADWLSYEKLESWSGAAYENGPDGKRRVKPDALTYWQYLGYCYWLWDARMMAEMARATGRGAEASGYLDMADRVLKALRERYVAEDGMLIELFRDMQTPALFALKFGILNKPEAVAATKAALLKNIKDHSDCLQTGFLGTSILMDTMTYDVGAPDVAYTLLLQHKNPSWLYSVDQGATTIWERWNSYTKADGFAPSGMNSFNHYAYGAVVSWMYGTMAGIRAGEDGGFRHFTLAPLPDPRMGNVYAEYRSPYGTIKSAWVYEKDGRCTWTFTIPANTTATVKLPGSAAAEELSAGTYVRMLCVKRMMTTWGEKVTSENAWRGYPRPQMRRERWTNLNGEWDYAITSVTNTPGRPESWDGKIRVPYPLESALSGVGRLLKPDEFLWYTRKIECDPKPGERILLHFGGVDFRTMVFIGHDEVTDVPHEGGQNPFTLDITDYVKPGENELTVCVWDPTEDFVNSRGKQSFEPKGCFYTRVSGIWQTVWMETVPEKYIKSYKVFTDIDKGTVRFEFDKVDGAGEVEVTTDMPKDFECWSPENPKLYNFTAKYGSDVVKGYFGMRKFEKRRDVNGVWRFFLNNKPYFPIGTLDQGWWPDGLLTPPSEEAMEYDVRVLKDCGFNMLRKHIKVEPQQYYAMCDRLGILVIQDLPSGSGNPHDPLKVDTVKRYWLERQEMKEMMDGLQTFPSIVMWNPYNEGWTQPGEFLTHYMLDFTRRYDPSRLVNGPSGVWDWEGGHLLPKGWKFEDRVLTEHKPSGVCEAADTVDMHLYRGPTMFAVNDRRISFLGEFGGLGHPVSGHLWKESKDGKGNWGYGGTKDTETPEGLEKTYLGLMDKLGQYAEWGLGGSVYTQTTDVEIEINGILTYDRKVLKYNPAVLRKAHAEVIRRALEAPRTGLLHLSHVHRGGGKLERPDNTLETFKWCWENGSALECDCRKTKDGVGVMLHDKTLKRTARGIAKELAKKDVSSEVSWDEIKDVDVGSYLSPEFSHHRIPTIEATFAAMKGHPTYLCFVDEKGAGPEYIAKKAVEAGVQNQVYYTGQDYQKALDWGNTLPGGKTLIWIGTWPVPKHTAEDIARFEAHFEEKMDEMRANCFKGVSAVSLHTYYDPNAAEPFVPTVPYLKRIIAEFHANGIPVCSIPFEGGDKEEVYFKLFELGCDGFSTDYPSVMFSVIRKLKEGLRK